MRRKGEIDMTDAKRGLGLCAAGLAGLAACGELVDGAG